MEIRKIAIYSLFILAVIYGFYFHFPGGEGTVNDKKANAPVTEASVSANRVVAAGSTVRSPEIIVKEWKKDPFLNNRDHKTKSSVTRYDKPDKTKKPRLSAISSADGIKMAVVDGRVLRVGDSTGVWRLDEITDKAARFKGPNGSVWIKLGG